jgi:PAS domain-containing protein
MEIIDVMDAKVGITTGTAYDEFFRTWFPNHPNIVEFANPDDAFAAVARGEVDMVMSSQRQLTALTNYLELSGYKANIIFDRQSESIIGFNKDQALLCSIFNKALRIIDVSGIAEQWTQITYDYQAKMLQSQRPWLIGASVLLLCVIALLFLLFQRTKKAEIRLEHLVADRTYELEVQTSTIQLMFDSIPDLIFCKDTDLNFTRCNKSFENYLGVTQADILGKNASECIGFSIANVSALNESEKLTMDERRIISFE